MLIPGGYVEEKSETVLPVFRKFCDNNLNKVMIISLIKSKFLLKQFQKEWMLLNIVILEIRIPVHSNFVLKFHQGKSFNL